jgi:hypothetical protein
MIGNSKLYKKALVLSCMLALVACGASEVGGFNRSGDSSNVSVQETSLSNDDILSAQLVVKNSEISGNVSESSDVYDYYKFNVDTGDSLEITLTGPTSSSVDLDLYLANSSDIVLQSSVSSDSSERIIYTVGQDTSILYVKVSAYSGSGDYVLTIEYSDD